MTDARRGLPSVHALLGHELLQPLMAMAPRSIVADAVRDAIESARTDPAQAPRDDAGWVEAVRVALAVRQRPSLRAVVNATGVILHTNLGRAPLAPAAVAAIQDTASAYSNVEYDLERGARGSRYGHCVGLLRELTGAEDAIVVNNCAAALVLALNTLAVRRDAVVSRGELIEIGGGFRVPEIMAKSGAHLVEVGTTNRTYLADYDAAITPRTAAIVKVHRSNFVVDGFVASASLAELSELTTRRGLPLLHDFGSGLLLSLDRYGLTGEPTARDALAAGASLVVMSGDKLLGGPQAGIVLGDATLVARLRTNPLTRALRVDKLTIAALGATLALYRDPEHAITAIPILAMLTMPAPAVAERARRLASWLADRRIDAGVRQTEASVGGGAFPRARIPSAGVVVRGDATDVERRLRRADPPIIGRITDGELVLDLRTILPRDDDRLGEMLLAALR